MSDQEKLGQLFKACDLDGSGFIDQTELASVCSELNGDQLKDVFLQLDKDGDGRISAEEFARGFREINEALQGISREKMREKLKSASSTEGLNDMYSAGGLDESLKTLSCQEQVCELYQRLHDSNNTELLESFENIILGVIKDVRTYQTENERLEKSFRREKEAHEKHLQNLEEEMEAQTQKIDERVRKELQDKFEWEKQELKNQMDSEIVMLQQNLKKFQNQGDEEAESRLEQEINNLKSKVDELNYEKRTYKSELTDAQTNLALVRSELASIRQQFKDKCHECDTEKEMVMDYIKEQDNLTRQLHLLHDANKKLHDTNDDLRNCIENMKSYKRAFSHESGSSFGGLSPRHGSRKGSIMSDYFDNTPGNLPARTMSPTSSLAEELMSPDMAGRPRLHRLGSCDESMTGDMDSGRSTLRDINDLDSDEESNFADSRSLDARRRNHQLPAAGYEAEGEEYDSRDEMETEAESYIEPTEAEVYKGVGSKVKRPSSIGSRGSGKSVRSITREEGGSTLSSKAGRGSRRNLAATQEAMETKISKEPERMYKIVLAGDAAVGKSSFIMRLCKGKFVNNLSSTLGVDFQTKVIEVDGRTVALQLWDTAGQERFRSIAKSYFRRADGVLLLYDVTYERSFINVRDWVEAIEDGAQKRIPIMLCGNKTDMRAEMEQQGRRTVRDDEGQRLAKEFNGLFIEASAKDGSHVQEAVMELTRLLRTNEDLEVKTVGMQLHEMNMDKKSSACCRR